ncbi:MAG: MoaD/ThiS family protein [Nannocystaceae bacterium]|nr:MoaD/ThiS family protein [Myxococcales bacterium]
MAPIARAADPRSIDVELYGVVRLRAGVDRVALPAGTLAEVLGALARRCPALAPELIRDGHASAHLLVALDGREVIDDPARPIAPGSCLVLTSAQAGG